MKSLPWLFRSRRFASSLAFGLVLLGGVVECLYPPILAAQTLTFTGATPSVDFGDVNLCKAGETKTSPCSRTMTLSYEVIASGTLGATKVVTQGNPNLDFTLDNSSTCRGNVIQGNTCSVKVTFVPKFSGWRPGAVQLTGASGTVLNTTFINGYGIGPQLGFASKTMEEVPFTGLTVCINSENDACQTYVDNFCAHYAVDAAGDLFAACESPFSDTTTGAFIVVELPADGGPQVTLPFSGLYVVEGLALDGAGNIFALDSENSRVLELPAGGGPQIVLPFQLPNPGYAIDLSVDGQGNLYFADTLGNRIVELPASGGQVTAPFSGLSFPAAVAVDYKGNLFTTTDTNANQDGELVELPAGSPPQKELLSGTPNGVIGFGNGLTANGNGDLFVTDSHKTGLDSVLELPAGSTESIDLGLNASFGSLTATPSGDLFLAGTNYSVEIQRSHSAPLNFGSIPVGSTKTLALAVTNTGNRTLIVSPYFESPSYTIFSQQPTDCLNAIDPGHDCSLNIQFSALTEGHHTITLTLGSNGAKDSTVLLEGTGTK